MTQERTPWRAGVWDRPSNGARYCAWRRNPAAYSGTEAATDHRDGVLTFDSRDAAQRHADKLNAEVRDAR